MKTTFPDLSYNPTGIIWSDGPHSPACSAERYPCTDLQSFVHWNEFETEIHQVITAHMTNTNTPFGVEFDIGSLPKKPQEVSGEEDVRCEAKVQLHDLVLEVLEILGIEGRFLRPGSWNNQIVGAPDFSWLRNDTLHPKLVAEYKTKWVAPLADLPGYFRLRNPSVPERQSIDAVYQLYGYMTFNDHKYSVLSNMEYAWFFQRVEGGQTMMYYGPIGIDPTSSPSMLKAFVGIILLAEEASSPTRASSPIEHRKRAIRRSEVVAGSYDVLPLDPRLCHFDHTSVRHTPRMCFTLKAKLEKGVFATEEDVFCKVVDLFQRRDPIDALSQEMRNYTILKDLQGVVVPQVRGYYEIWGLLRFLVLEDVGTAIPEDRPIGGRTRTKMRAALSRIHSAGYIHGDIARRNFCMKGNVVFLVDLETLALGTLAERADELAALDEL